MLLMDSDRGVGLPKGLKILVAVSPENVPHMVATNQLHLAQALIIITLKALMHQRPR
jgi:hypothetical protein